MHLKGLVVLACRGLQSFRLRFASFCLVDAAGAISGPDFGHRRSHLAVPKAARPKIPNPKKTQRTLIEPLAEVLEETSNAPCCEGEGCQVGAPGHNGGHVRPRPQSIKRRACGLSAFFNVGCPGFCYLGFLFLGGRPIFGAGVLVSTFLHLLSLVLGTIPLTVVTLDW